MAPPFRWYDEFWDAGWHRVLRPATLRLILTIARRVDGVLHTRTSLARFQREAGLARATFFRAKAQLIGYGLIAWSKERGWTLISPVPSPRVKGLSPETKGSQQRDPLVSPIGPTDGRSPRQDRLSAPDQQKSRKQLGEQTRGPGYAVVRGYLKGLGLDAEAITAFEAAIVALKGGAGATLPTEAFLLSRMLQSGGLVDWYEDRVRTVLADAVALAHPVIEAGVRIFDVSTVEVVRAET